jgi:hypothetical protein
VTTPAAGDTLLIIDLSSSPPSVLPAASVLPAVIQGQLAGIAAQLTDIQKNLGTIMTAESSYQADMSALQAFFADLTTQLAAIKAQVAGSVTDTSALDALSAQAAALQPTVDSIVPPAAPAAPAAPSDSSGTTPSS